MSNNTVTVLIPTFNRAHYLSECLDSILSQTIKPHQIIVIDDGSEDGTQSLLEAYAGQVTVLKKANGGKSTALNLGLQHVTGNFVWVFDDDDVALPDAIEKRLKIFASNPEVEFVYTSHFWGCDGDKKIQIINQQNIDIPSPAEYFYTVLTGFFFALQSVLVRTECFEKTGQYDESLFRGQDYDMLIRLGRHCSGMGINEPTFIFRKHAGVRGPIQELHLTNNSNDMWAKYDITIATKIRESLALEEYLAERTYDLANVEQSCREALIRRMSVMSSKGLVAEMIDDLKQAINAAPDLELSADERLICRKLVCFPRLLSELRNNSSDIMNCLQEISKTKAGGQVAGAMMRGFFWLVRSPERDLNERLLYLHLLLRCFKLALRI